MEIKNCKRCGEPWCFHGTGRPIRCGKCKSPYWDRERVNESGQDSQGRVGGSRVPETSKRTAQVREHSRQVVWEQGVGICAPFEPGVDEGAGGDAEAVEMCPYTEYDPEDGETYRCGLAKHGPKVKHTRGRKV